jgi:hypothetical protein
MSEPGPECYVQRKRDRRACPRPQWGDGNSQTSSAEPTVASVHGPTERAESELIVRASGAFVQEAARDAVMHDPDAARSLERGSRRQGD